MITPPPLSSRKIMSICMYLHLNPSFLLSSLLSLMGRAHVGHISWVANSPCSLHQWMANSVVLVASCISLNLIFETIGNCAAAIFENTRDYHD